jgi:hypothetical protein
VAVALPQGLVILVRTGNRYGERPAGACCADLLMAAASGVLAPVRLSVLVLSSYFLLPPSSSLPLLWKSPLFL